MIPKDEDDDATASLPNLEELLARMALPDTPRQSIDLAPDIVGLVSTWHVAKAVKLLAGLMTDPHLQVHLTRLDWAARLVLGLADGSRRPKTGRTRQAVEYRACQLPAWQWRKTR